MHAQLRQLLGAGARRDMQVQEGQASNRSTRRHQGARQASRGWQQELTLAAAQGPGPSPVCLLCSQPHARVANTDKPPPTDWPVATKGEWCRYARSVPQANCCTASKRNTSLVHEKWFASTAPATKSLPVVHIHTHTHLCTACCQLDMVRAPLRQQGSLPALAAC